MLSVISLGTINGGNDLIKYFFIGNNFNIENLLIKSINPFGISIFISMSLDKKKISSFCPYNLVIKIENKNSVIKSV